MPSATELNEPIKAACTRGDVAAVARMLDHSPELLTKALWPPTVYQAKSLEVTRLLLDRGLDPDVCSAPRRAIDLAVYQGSADIVELLIARGADAISKNRLGERPIDLLDAYEPRPLGDESSQRILSALLAAGAIADIHVAVRAGDMAVVSKMLDADPALLKTQEPWPPLFSAARAGRIEIVRLLLTRGAEVNARNSKENTALWFACQSSAAAEDRIAVARELINAGAHVLAGCEEKSTALHYAAWRGPIGMVELLLRSGAKEWQPDTKKKLPVDYAELGNAPDEQAIIKLLDRPVIRDPLFKQAVAAIHAGDESALRRLLSAHPNLVHDRAVEPDCYPPSYFSNPKLLWFVANNPTLMATMPENIVQIATAIIDHGAEPADLQYTMGLAMTSFSAREKGLQWPLIHLLMSRGARPTTAEIYGALAHCEVDSANALLDSGLPMTAPIAAALGRNDELSKLLPGADREERQAALSLAVINRQVESARVCLDGGAEVNGFLIVHKHCMPLHQAAVNDDVPMLKLLVERQASLDTRDALWNGTPLGWATHTNKPAAKEYLQSIGAR